jgi:hypothetical protein
MNTKRFFYIISVTYITCIFSISRTGNARDILKMPKNKASYIYNYAKKAYNNTRDNLKKYIAYIIRILKEHFLLKNHSVIEQKKIDLITSWSISHLEKARTIKHLSIKDALKSELIQDAIDLLHTFKSEPKNRQEVIHKLTHVLQEIEHLDNEYTQ